MRILYLHQHYKSLSEHGSTRSYYIAEYLGKNGHEVTIYCGGSTELLMEQEHHKAIRLKIQYSNSMSFYQRGLAFQKFNMAVYRRILKDDPYDLCIATSTPLNVGFIAMRLKRKFKLPYIFEVRDLWPKAPVEMGYIRQRWFKNWLYRSEKRIYEGAECIVTTSPPQQENIVNRYPELRVELISNFADAKDYQKREDYQSTLQERWDRGIFRMVYIGAIGKSNGLEQLEGLVKALIDRKVSLEIDIYGDGALRKQLEVQFTESNYNMITFRDPVPKKDISELLKEYDFAYISFAQFDVLSSNSPNKFFDAMAAGLYCVTNIKSWFGDLAEKEGFGVYALAGKEEKAVSQIEEILVNPKRLLDSSNLSKTLCDLSYSTESQGLKYLELIDSIS